MDDPEVFYTAAGMETPYGMGNLGNMLEHAVPIFAGRSEWYELLFADPGSDRLTMIMNSLNANLTGDGLLARRTTPLGRRFLNFITDNG